MIENLVCRVRKASGHFPGALTAVVCLFSSMTLEGCGGAASTSAEPVGPEGVSTEPAEVGAAPEDSAAASPPTPASAQAGGTEEKWEGEAEATEAPKDTGKEVETRTTEVIAKIIKDNRQPFRDCYEKGAKELPDLQGTLTLHFVLDPEGKVKVAELNLERSTIKAPTVVECAVATLKTMKFPPSSRGMESTVNYPFDFKKR